jgi:3',5'-nucleoside bisphosphate phosphatase
VELISLVARRGLQGVSITDHDTIEAYMVAADAARAKGVQLLAGVELSARDLHESVHVLGYGFDLENAEFRAFCESRVIGRRERNRKILDRLRQRGMPISEEDVERVAGIVGKRIFGRPHIARALLQKGYVKSMREAFERWLGEGCAAFVPDYEVTVQRAVDIIHAAEGKAVIAHPHHLRHPETVRRLMEMNFDGIECYYPLISRQAEQLWIARAREKGWLVTGGSDFHGANRPHAELGSAWVDRQTFEALQRKLPC